METDPLRFDWTNLSLTQILLNKQVEVHPFFPQRALRAFCRTHGILVQAYSSLGQNDPTLREHPVVLAIAAHRGMTPAQVLLRCVTRLGDTV